MCDKNRVEILSALKKGKYIRIFYVCNSCNKKYSQDLKDFHAQDWNKYHIKDKKSIYQKIKSLCS